MIVKPENYGPAGQGFDDTPFFNAALNDLRLNPNIGALELDGVYKVGAINASNMTNVLSRAKLLEIVMSSGTEIIGDQGTVPAPIFDLFGTRAKVSGEGVVYSGPNSSAAFLIGGTDKTVLEDVFVRGSFKSGCLNIVQGFSVTIERGQYMNYDQTQPFGAPAVSISTNQDWGASSLFHNFSTPTPYTNCEDIYFNDVELHCLIANTPANPSLPPAIPYQSWTVYMRAVSHVVFNGGICDNSGVGHMLFQGNSQGRNCENVTSIGQKFYSEHGRSSQSVFNCDNGWNLKNLKVINPHIVPGSAGPVTQIKMGPGTFPGFAQL